LFPASPLHCSAWCNNVHPDTAEQPGCSKLLVQHAAGGTAEGVSRDDMNDPILSLGKWQLGLVLASLKLMDWPKAVMSAHVTGVGTTCPMVERAQTLARLFTEIHQLAEGG